MKKISKSISIICAVALLAIGATYAYFSDSEILAENTLAAGTLDLKVDGEDNPTSSINIADLMPGDSREFTWTIRNDGNITGTPSITFGDVENFENDMTEPESNVDDSYDFGELGDRVRARMSWSQGDNFKTIRLWDQSGNPKLNDISGATVGMGLLTSGGNDNALPHLANGEEITVKLIITCPNTVGNIIQSDSSSFDITFNLIQEQGE